MNKSTVKSVNVCVCVSERRIVSNNHRYTGINVVPKLSQELQNKTVQFPYQTVFTSYSTTYNKEMLIRIVILLLNRLLHEAIEIFIRPFTDARRKT